MPYFSRQIVVSLAQGNVQADGAFKKVWDFQDVLWRTKLIIDNGKSEGGKISIPASGTQTLPLPAAYDNTKYLFVMIAAYGLVQVDVTPVAVATKRMLLKGETSREGMTCFNDFITSVSVSNPSSTDAVFIEYSFVELPNLALPESYREGTIVRGIV